MVSRLALVGAVLGSSAVSLYRIHPYELSYYNELIGGPRGAWERGFELSYWYDAFTDPVIDDLNRRLPPGAEVDFLNEMTKTAAGTFYLRKDLGSLRGDIILGRPDPAVSFRLAADPGLEGDGLHAALVCDATLVCERAAPARWRTGRFGGRSGGRVARLGAFCTARCGRPQPERPARGS